MKIVIDKVLDKNIYFSTDYGMAKGIWKGTNRPIQKNIVLSWILTDYTAMIMYL